MVKQSKNQHRQVLKSYFFYSLIFLIYLIPITIIFRRGFDDILELFRRLAGLTGLSSLFIAILLSLLIRQSRQIFGVSYLKIHHLFSITGLILISLHPIIMAIDFGTAGLFIPDFSSWHAFLTNAGRPALYLIYIATAAALLRKNIRKYWKYLHTLIYLAFIFGAIHGILLGSDTGNIYLYILLIAMIILVIVAFFYKRYLNFK